MKTKVVSFSGGQSSAYMLKMLIDQHGLETFNRDFLVCFANTGKEFDETLDFVRDVEENFGINVVWLEYRRENGEHSFGVVSYNGASRRCDPRPFDALLDWTRCLPNVRRRGCSGQLKNNTIRRYLKSIGLEAWTLFLGIRADESDRCVEILAECPSYASPQFPMVEAGTTKADVDSFWMANSFRLNIPNYKGNCDLCFLKAKWKRISIMRHEPESAKWWIDWEKKFKARGAGAGSLWVDGVSYQSLLNEATHPEFDFVNADQSEPDIPCSCAVGGFREDSA